MAALWGHACSCLFLFPPYRVRQPPECNLTRRHRHEVPALQEDVRAAQITHYLAASTRPKQRYLQYIAHVCGQLRGPAAELAESVDIRTPGQPACTRPRAWAGGLRTFARAHAFSYCLRRELGSNGLRGPGWSRAAAVVSETSIGQCGSCSNASMMKMLVHAYTSDV